MSLILIDDPDPDSAEATALLLMSWGFEVEHVKALDNAVDIAAPDLLLLCHGKGVDGRDTVGQLRTIFGRQLPAIALALRPVEMSEFRRVLLKPVEPSVLLRALRESLAATGTS